MNNQCLMNNHPCWNLSHEPLLAIMHHYRQIAIFPHQIYVVFWARKTTLTIN